MAESEEPKKGTPLFKLLNSLAKAEEDLKFSKLEWIDMKAERDKFKTERDSLEKRNENNKKSKNEYKKKFMNANSMLQDYNDKQRQIETLTGKIKARDKEIERLRENREVEENKLHKFLRQQTEEDLANLREQEKEWKKKWDDQEQELNKLQDDLDECNAKFEELDGFYGDLKNEFKDYKTAIKSEEERKKKEQDEEYARIFSLPEDDPDADPDVITFSTGDTDDEDDTPLDFSIPELKSKSKKKTDFEKALEEAAKQREKETKEFEKKRKERLKAEKKKKKEDEKAKTKKLEEEEEKEELKKAVVMENPLAKKSAKTLIEVKPKPPSKPKTKKSRPKSPPEL